MDTNDRSVVVKSSRHLRTLRDFSEVIEQASNGCDVVVLSRVHDPVHLISVGPDENMAPILVPRHAVRLHFRRTRDGEHSFGTLYLNTNPDEKRKELFRAVAYPHDRHYHAVSKSGQVCIVSGQLPENIELYGKPRSNDKPAYHFGSTK